MEYWAIINGEKTGPMTLGQLEACNITSATKVWHRGLADWVDAGTLPDLQHIIRPQYAPGQQPAPQAAPYTNPYGGTAPLRPSNHLAWSIIVTLLCCQVTGIIAIIYSSMVDSRYNRGDYAGAVSASKTARGWVIASVACGLIGIVFYILIFVAGIFGSIVSAL
ncbi:MAG: CD225/dispanin family protein [Muribaculum sp.]|nr:CD225/dispanin family protein [Muribaculum sp.]